MRVASGCLHLKDAVFYRQKGHVERAATHVVDQYIAFSAALLIKSIRDCGRSRLIDDAQHVQPADLTSIFCCLALRVVEVGRNSDHSIAHFGAKICLRCLFILMRTIDETSSGWNFFSSPWNCTTIMGLSPPPEITLKGQSLMSACTTGSLNFLPISLLASKTVFSGFLATWFFAASPIRRSLSVNAT